jgi:hypothetical protein
MGQIKYFPLDKCKKLTHEERRKLLVQQNMITGARNEMYNRIKDMPKYWQVIERSLFHQQFKDRIRNVNDLQNDIDNS